LTKKEGKKEKRDNGNKKGKGRGNGIEKKGEVRKEKIKWAKGGWSR